jgi:fructosamine-3-kinase
MFGGIPMSFFEEYHKHMPKTEPVDQYELRGDLYELFYLNDDPTQHPMVCFTAMMPEREEYKT